MLIPHVSTAIFAAKQHRVFLRETKKQGFLTFTANRKRKKTFLFVSKLWKIAPSKPSAMTEKRRNNTKLGGSTFTAMSTSNKKGFPTKRTGKKARARFRMVSSRGDFAHAERILPHREQLQAQAHDDWYGVLPELNDRANICSMDALLSDFLDSLPTASETATPTLLKEGWTRAVGDFIASHSELISLSGGTAIVCTTQPSIRYELERMKKQLIGALQQEFGATTVRHIMVRMG